MTGERNDRVRHSRLLIAMLVACAAAAGLGLRVVAPAAAAPQSHPVEIRSNVFEPRVINIAPGDTVTWTAIDGGHTVEADDGRFNFFPQRFLNRNETVSFTFLTEETVRYHCRVHGADGGAGMAGVIIVGAGSPVPTPTPTPTVVEHRSVPSQYATVRAALAGIPPGGVVHLAPGVYHEAIEVRTPGVTIQGDGPPGSVTIDGQGSRRTGVMLAARDTAVRSVTVANHRAEGVAIRAAGGVRIADVIVRNNGGYGVLAADATGATITRVDAAGHRVAGIAVQGCDDCDVIIEAASATANLYGVLLDNAGSVVVRDSSIHDNGTGVVVRSLATGDSALARGAHITGNRITGNRATLAAASATEFPVRSGVWVAGAWFTVVEDNEITGHDYGVLVTSAGVPTVDARIAANVIGGSAVADLAWDGIGAGVCFEGNGQPAGGPPTTRPPLAQTIYACDGARGPGVPEPLVIADLARYAAGV